MIITLKNLQGLFGMMTLCDAIEVEGNCWFNKTKHCFLVAQPVCAWSLNFGETA